MIQVTPQMRILVAIEPADFRKGIDGLARICREEINVDPFCGALFIFRNRSGTSMKALAYDGQGYWLCQKRLSRGRFRWWPETDRPDALHRELAAHELQILLWSGNPEGSGIPPEWKRIEPGVLHAAAHELGAGHAK